MLQKVVVGVCGYAQSGKDTVADYLVKNHGFVKRSFADSLRDDLMVLNPILDVFPDGTKVRFRDGMANYEVAKRAFPEFRTLMQVYGTEVHRDRDAEFWIKRHHQWVMEHPEFPAVVVADVRFPNEAEYVDVLIRVTRPGVGPVNDHVSDNMIEELPWNFIVENTGSVEDLWKQVEATRLAW